MMFIGVFQQSWKYDQISLITISSKPNPSLDSTSTVAIALADPPFIDELLERAVYTHCL